MPTPPVSRSWGDYTPELTVSALPAGGGSMLAAPDEVGEAEDHRAGKRALGEPLPQEGQGHAGALRGFELKERVLGGADQAERPRGVPQAEVDDGLIQLHVGGLGAPSGGGEPLLGRFEVQKGPPAVAQAGPDPAFQPEQVEALGLVRGELVAMRAEEAAG